MFALCRLSVHLMYRHSISRRRASSFNMRRITLKNGSTAAAFRVDPSLRNFRRTTIESQTLWGRVAAENRVSFWFVARSEGTLWLDILESAPLIEYQGACNLSRRLCVANARSPRLTPTDDQVAASRTVAALKRPASITGMSASGSHVEIYKLNDGKDHGALHLRHKSFS
jgi:hypothetical protein